MNIEQITTKLTELGFVLQENNAPKFDQYTGEKLPEPSQQVYRLQIDKFIECVAKISLAEMHNSNAVIQNKYSTVLFIEDLPTISPFWDLFIKLVEEKVKC